MSEDTNPTLYAVMVALFGDIYSVLVEKNLLTQGDAISRLEKLSQGASRVSANPGFATSLIDGVRDYVADELDRKPS